jgi:hypothetical protein
MEDLQMTTRLNVRNLADLCGCYHALVWGSIDKPIQPVEVDSTDAWTREEHINRIAWFVIHGWDTPIEIKIDGVSSRDNFFCGWPVVDGLHRVAAALVRLDDSIEAVVTGSLKNHSKLMATSIIRLDDLAEHSC